MFWKYFRSTLKDRKWGAWGGAGLEPGCGEKAVDEVCNYTAGVVYTGRNDEPMALPSLIPSRRVGPSRRHPVPERLSKRHWQADSGKQTYGRMLKRMPLFKYELYACRCMIQSVKRLMSVERQHPSTSSFRAFKSLRATELGCKNKTQPTLGGPIA